LVLQKDPSRYHEDVILSTVFAVVLAAAPGGSLPSNYESVVRGFVAGLESSEMSGFSPVALPGVAPSWPSVREILDKHERMTIRSFSWTFVDETTGLVRLDLEGSGVVVGLRREEHVLPPVWFLTIEPTADGPRIANVETEGNRVGRFLSEAKTDPEKRAVRRRYREVPLLDIVSGMHFSRPFEERDVPAVHAALAFVMEAAEVENDLAAEVSTLIHLSVMSMRESGDPTTPEPSKLPKEDESRRIAKVAVELALRSGDCDVIAAARFHLGNLYAWQGDLESGNQQLELVGAIGDQLRDGRVALKAMVNRAVYKFRIGDLRSALNSVELCSTKARLYGWAQGESSAIWMRADIQSAVGDYSAASRSYEFVAASFEAAGIWDRAAVALSDLAEMERKLGRASDAIATQAKAIAIMNRAGVDTALVKASHALLLTENGQLAKASLVLDEIEEKQDPKSQRSVQFWYARAMLSLARGEHELALSESRRVTPVHDDDLLWQGKAVAARALRGLGRNDEAILELRNAIGIIEERRSRLPSNEIGRARYFESRVEPYRELVDVYFALGRHEEALRTAELLKARSLLDTVSIARSDLSTFLSDSEGRRLEELKRVLDELNRKLMLERGPIQRAGMEAERARARHELEQFNDEMAIRHPVGSGVRASEASVDLQSALPSRSVAIVEYVVLPRSTIVLAAFRDESDRIVVRGQRIAIGSRELEARVQQLRASIDARAIGSRAIARSMYDLLLAPIDRWIASPDALILVPDGSLWQVPFAALERPSAGPVVLDKAVVYCPSLSTFRIPRQPGQRPPRSLLALGDASTGVNAISSVRSAKGERALGRLPDAASEVRTIAAQYGASRSAVYVGEDATETRLKSAVGNYRIIHLATHAITDSRWPMFSSIFLTPTPEDDGILEAREVAGLKIDADLAVLSACDTAQGRVLSGEGVIGLSWAFLSAGCPNTVVSQWGADSKATEKQMVAFHRRLRLGESIPQALRHAQLELRKNPRYADPFYWAPFVVIGPGR